MLKPAQLYATKLNDKFISSWYDLSNIYYNGAPGSFSIELPDNNIDTHNFVSVDSDNNIIGYICYSITWNTRSANHFGIISFDKGNLKFIKDVMISIDECFTKYNLNRVEWYCYEDNPAINMYRNFIKHHGGVQSSYYREVSLLMDGKLHNTVGFEILKSEYKPLNFKGGKS